MNQNIQAILLKVVLELKKLKWLPGKDWEITLKSEGHVPLVKQITVYGAMDDNEWKDTIDTHIELKIESDDQITYFPEYTIYANIMIDGGSSKDIVYKMDADVAFTDKELGDTRKIDQCAKRINRSVEDHIEEEYSDYIDNNADEIEQYKQGGWQEPEYRL